MSHRLLVLFAETPIHAGGGESVGVVDLPIQREASTGLPVIWGQSLKGALREAVRADSTGAVDERAVFGSRPPGFPGADGDADDGSGDGQLTRGQVSVGDAQLMLFPAPTLHNGFAWVTANLVLARLARKWSLMGADPGQTLRVPEPGGMVLAGTNWSGRQIIGPYLLGAQPGPDASRIGAVFGALACPDNTVFDYSRGKLGRDVLVAADEVLCGVAESGTDVVARVQLEPLTKSVRNGPFYSEHLPAETVLVALLTGPEEHLAKLQVLLHDKPLQIGGNETIGNGIVWCRLHDAASIRRAANPGPVDTASNPVDAPQPASATPAGNRPSPASLAPRRTP